MFVFVMHGVIDGMIVGFRIHVAIVGGGGVIVGILPMYCAIGGQRYLRYRCGDSLIGRTINKSA